MKKALPSFIPLSQDMGERALSDADRLSLDKELVAEVIESFANSEYEVALSVYNDARLIRIYDGGYMFSPVGLRDPWDMRGALEAVRDYAVKEMIPLIFTDVLREELDVYTDLFRFVEARAYDDEDTFWLSIDSECSTLESMPEISDGEMTLSEIKEEDKEAYGYLCMDDGINRYYGYEGRADNPDGDPDIFIETARRELDQGIALNLGVYFQGEFVGDGVIYAFDFSGGASVAVRILPERQGTGLGTRALSLLVELGRKIGLLHLYTEVMTENSASMAMTGKLMKNVLEEDGRAYFELNLE